MQIINIRVMSFVVEVAVDMVVMVHLRLKIMQLPTMAVEAEVDMVEMADVMEAEEEVMERLLKEEIKWVEVEDTLVEVDQIVVEEEVMEMAEMVDIMVV